MDINERTDGEVKIIDGETYWMGNLVHKCPDCGVAPTNVDDCGHFGDPKCPYFGKDRDA